MVFGIDVGGTTVKIGLIENDKILDKYEIPTCGETFIEDICNSLKGYMKEHNIESIDGIGFGLPGNVINNYIYNLPNMGVKNLDLVKEVSKYFPGVKIEGQNDANVAALGEMLYHNEYKSAVMLTLGTGVGAGIVVDGKLIQGSHGNGGEAGHMVIADDYNFQCSCGLKGCLETVASATGVVRLANEYLNNMDSVLKGAEIDAKAVFDAAKAGDELALKVVNEVGDYIGKAAAFVAAVVDPDAFIIGGGVSRAGKILMDVIEASYLKYTFHISKNTPFILASLGNDGGMLGAALLAKR